MPGFYHRKAEPYLVRIVEASGRRYTRDELLEAFPPPKPQPRSVLPTFPSTRSNQVTEEDAYRIANALKAVDPDPYDSWVRVGMILHAAYGGDADGLHVWMSWAQASAKFDEQEHRYKWRTFGKGRGPQLGLGSLFLMADQAVYMG